jgi:outer membrane protein OmpA-like peptidoglycan-associated protein
MLGVSALAIAGCTNLPGSSLGATFGAERYLNGTHGGSDFNGALASEYTELGRRAAFKDTLWLNSTAYIAKAQQAEAGVTPAAWTPAEIGVNGDATSLYDTVVSTIAANKDARPAECARAQAMWDQYLEALRGGSTFCIHPDDARALLDEALAACGVTGPANFIVYFGFDKTNLTDAARATIDEVVAAVNAMGTSALSLVGHAEPGRQCAVDAWCACRSDDAGRTFGERSRGRHWRQRARAVEPPGRDHTLELSGIVPSLGSLNRTAPRTMCAGRFSI